MRERAKPAVDPDQINAPEETEFRPLTQIADWLIDAVHDRIADDDQFDAAAIARQYAVPKSSVERAARMDRPSSATV